MDFYGPQAGDVCAAAGLASPAQSPDLGYLGRLFGRVRRSLGPTWADFCPPCRETSLTVEAGGQRPGRVRTQARRPWRRSTLQDIADSRGPEACVSGPFRGDSPVSARSCRISHKISRESVFAPKAGQIEVD